MSIDRVNKKFFLRAVSGSLIGKSTDVDIAVRCPICGDSNKKKNSARLHIYHKEGVDFIKCFNGDCPVQNKSPYSFLRDFFPSILSEYKRETFTGTMSKLANGDVFERFKPKKQIIKDPVITQDLSMYMTDLVDNPEAMNYIKNRGIEYDPALHGKWYYGHQDLKIGDVLYHITGSVIIPLYYNNVMYGFYSRSIKQKSFITYMNDANIGYKVFNFFNIDNTKPVYIMEGIFDALSINCNNVIALLGAKLSDTVLKSIKHPVFVLDNDRTGILNSIDYANKGYSVFVQPNTYSEKDMNELALNHKDIDVSNLVTDNIFNGISATIRLQQKL